MNNDAKNGPSEHVEWDDEVTSLGRRTRRDGPDRWIVQFRVRGEMRKRIIGDGTKLNIDEARRAAIVAMEHMRIGAPVVPMNEPPSPHIRIIEFGERYLRDAAPRWKPATRAGHRACFEKNIYPLLGSTRVAELTQMGVMTWRDSFDQKPGTVNRSTAILSGMMRHAEVLGLRPPGSNPCMGLRKKKSDFTAEYLSVTGYRQLSRTLRTIEATRPVEAAVIRFLALTGCRRGEALNMEWDWVTHDAVNLPDSKTGPRTIWLGQASRELLGRIERTGRYVFAIDGAPLKNSQLNYVWNDVRSRMSRPSLRVHDLRHSFASIGLNHGEDFGTIGGLLGHADKATTKGYAHLAVAPVKEAPHRVGEMLALKSRLTQRPGSRKTDAPRGQDPFAEVKKFRKAGMSLQKYCAANDVDLETLRKSIRKWNRTAGR